MGLIDSDNPPLLQSTIHLPPIKRTGTLWTAVAHIVTGVIGSGVLALGWSMAQLGWIAGPLAMLVFAAVTLMSTFLICDCYKYPDADHGPARNRSFTDAVRLFLGERCGWICGLLMNISFYSTGIAYVITSAKCFRAIERANCYHTHGHEALCESGLMFYMLLFGVVQIFMSQIPDFHSMELLSVVASIMSFSYSFIGLGLGVARVIGNGTIEGSFGGTSTSTKTQKTLLVSQALGDIAFAYPYSTIVLSIQDTLRSHPPENATMKQASTISICIATFFYLACGGFGYAAFGDQTPGNLLTGFGFYEPYWLIDFANACVVVHLVGGYQVYTQPLFATFDEWCVEQFPESLFINRQYVLKPIPFLPAWHVSLHRLCSRTVYVVSTTGIAMMFPYFNQVLGVSGAITFWPLTIYFPVEMWLKQRNVGAWTGKWIALRVFAIVCFCIAMFALAGSFAALIAARLS